MPFADCASKWYVNQKSASNDAHKVSSDEEDGVAGESNDGPGDGRVALRRSKRTSAAPERTADDDTDALSELETLAKLGRIEDSLPPERWFSERALETRLHHIAHAVQNREWPAAAAAAAKPDVSDDRKHAQKRHIAIDVETDRAKLHALLSSPQQAHSGGATPTPAADVAPPPAHQRVAASPAPPAPPAAPAQALASAPVDLSAPLDLSEAHDFSVARRTDAAQTPARGRLDDTLSRLMKRKNVVSTHPYLIIYLREIIKPIFELYKILFSFKTARA